jgi:hypothetical protein
MMVVVTTVTQVVLQLGYFAGLIVLGYFINLATDKCVRAFQRRYRIHKIKKDEEKKQKAHERAVDDLAREHEKQARRNREEAVEEPVTANA